MTKKVKKCERNTEVCDWCIFYDFNEDEDGGYADNGYCHKHRKKSDPMDYCDDFICECCNKNLKRSDLLDDTIK